VALPDWDSEEGPDRPGLTHEIRSLILQLASERKAAAGPAPALGRDFLGSIIDNSRDQLRAEDFVVDNCKDINYAGHETSAVTATWCLMLLAARLGQNSMTNLGTLWSSSTTSLHERNIRKSPRCVRRLDGEGGNVGKKKENEEGFCKIQT
jgi:cytochrome P450